MNRILFLLVVAAMTNAPLRAEKYFFESPKPPGELIPAVVDALGNAGFKFNVTRIYNEAKDGKQGFTFQSIPTRIHAEITFHTDGKATIVRFYSPDNQESRRFYRFFTQTMKLKESGANTDIQSNDSSWPVPPNLRK